jgi:S1-C subfamily serine protease
MVISGTTRMALAAAALCLASLSAEAQEPASTRPALDELNREIHSLYEQAQGGMLRLQLPSPQWINDYTLAPLSKYQQIDPALKQMLAELQRQSNLSENPPSTIQLNANGSFTVRPQSQRSGAPESQPAASQPGTIIVVHPPAQDSAPPPGGVGGPLELGTGGQPDFEPTHVGLLLDDRGDVLVPIYLEREVCQDHPIRLAQLDGQIVDAKFIGSDRQTNLTIVKMDRVTGKPLPMGDRIDLGSVCLFVSPIDGSARLGVWTAGQRDWGYVLATDGHVAGVARAGQILSGSACRLIAGEIEQFGSVRRPTLGVAVRQVILVDATKHHRVVMQVIEVQASSAADKAGLRPGDIFELFNGEPISDASSLAAAMAVCKGKTPIAVLRNDESVSLSADLVLPDPPKSPLFPSTQPSK